MGGKVVLFVCLLPKSQFVCPKLNDTVRDNRVFQNK